LGIDNFIYTLKLFQALLELGIPGSATYAQTLTGIEEMMTVLPDNTGNEISAQDMRNVVLTLYEDIQGGSFSEFVYTDTPSNLKVGGMPKGQVFASMSLFTIFNKLFHDEFDPSAGLSFVGLSETKLDFKQPNTPILYPYDTGFDELVSFKLKWTATKGTYDFQSTGTITRTPSPNPPEVVTAGDPIFTVPVPLGGGSAETPPTKPRLNQSNTYLFTCKDSRGKSATAPVSLSYGHRVYWGKRSNRNALTSTDIRALDGAGVSGNGEIRSLAFTGDTTKGIKLSFPNINGAGQYLCWAWPSSFGDPVFRTATGIVTIAEKTQSQLSYKNAYGYTENYDVWVTYSTSASPIAELNLF
jgi:hypothetical protein